MGELCNWRSGKVTGHEVNAQGCTSSEADGHSYWLIGGVIEEGILDTSWTLSKLRESSSSKKQTSEYFALIV
ncbi:hypothetical protein ACTXT7_016749 [Hymenolepis weldensis]